MWWFYLFYLPMFLNRNYGLDTRQAYVFILAVYVISSVGSIFGGTLSGWRMNRGHSVNSGRKFAMLCMAVLVLPLVFVPHMSTIFPHNAWPAALLIAIAAAAHQGWSANLFSTPSDMFPSTAVSTVVGIGAAGAVGGAALHLRREAQPLAASVAHICDGCQSLYLISQLAIFQLLVPRLGAPREPELPLSVA